MAEVPKQDEFAVKDVEAVPPSTATAAPPPAAEVKQDKVAETTKQLLESYNAMKPIDFIGMCAFFSFVQMIPAAQVCNNSGSFFAVCDDYTKFAIAAGAIPGAIGFIVYALEVAGKGLQEKAIGLIALFLYLWWVASVIVLTFFDPWKTTVTANGYFGSWFAFIAASLAMSHSGLAFHEKAVGLWQNLTDSQKPAMFLFMSSSVVMGAAIPFCSPSSSCTNYNAFAIALAVISQCFSLFIAFFAGKLGGKNTTMLAQFLCLWWIVGTGVVTFGAPFVFAGNGYFGSFASCFLSFVVVRQAVSDQ